MIIATLVAYLVFRQEEKCTPADITFASIMGLNGTFRRFMPGILCSNGIHSHLVSDHGHYWECGGATYHTQYTTWENIRGQEGDPWAPVVGGAEDTEPNCAAFTEGLRSELYKQNLANRTRVTGKEQFPLVKTFDQGIKFLEENDGKDSCFLQIESFSPHEPFMAVIEFKDLYPGKAKSKKYEWLDYAPVKESTEEVNEVRYAYFADLTMCDEQLGRILNYMDEKSLWKDTMLIVNTDHGFMLGDHGYWAKNYMLCYDEIVHTPLFIWDPRFPGAAGTCRQGFVQTIDLPVTIMKFFGINPAADMQGQDISLVIREDKGVHLCGLFGIFGAHICCTDGRYVYMRAPRNLGIPLHEYTLMPTHMMNFFTQKELETMEKHGAYSFTKNCPVMQINAITDIRCFEHQDYLLDLLNDPGEERPVISEKITNEMERKMVLLMKWNEAPKEHYLRGGFV